MKTLLFSILTLACTFAQAQNTNLGTGAGNAGSANTSIGYFAGDVVTACCGTFVGHNSGKSVTTGNYNSFMGGIFGLSNFDRFRKLLFGVRLRVLKYNRVW